MLGTDKWFLKILHKLKNRLLYKFCLLQFGRNIPGRSTPGERGKRPFSLRLGLAYQGTKFLKTEKPDLSPASLTKMNAIISCRHRGGHRQRHPSLHYLLFLLLSSYPSMHFLLPVRSCQKSYLLCLPLHRLSILFRRCL